MKTFKSIVLLLILLFGFFSFSNAQVNNIDVNSSQMQKFLKYFPCIRGILDDNGAFVELSDSGNLTVKLPKTGVPEYDNEGGLTFYPNGIVQKTGQPRATGTYSCIKNITAGKENISHKSTLNTTGDGNTHTGLSEISIHWQTDAEGKDLGSAGTTPDCNCDDKPLPHEKGCFSVEISEVQKCIGGIYVDGVLNDKTIEKLTAMGYDMSQGLTKHVYDSVISNCNETETEKRLRLARIINPTNQQNSNTTSQTKNQTIAQENRQNYIKQLKQILAEFENSNKDTDEFKIKDQYESLIKKMNTDKSKYGWDFTEEMHELINSIDKKITSLYFWD